MKSYHILDCKEQQKIADCLYDYFLLITKNRKIKHFWNPLSREEIKNFLMMTSNPVSAWFEGLKLKVRDMSFTFYDKGIYTGIHRDEPPVIAKINFPVLNTAGTYNLWFDDDHQEIDRVECTKPIVFRSDILHTAMIGNSGKWPRIQFSFCFYKEPLDLLK